MQNTVIHEIPAVWDGEIRILMLGTMPSPASREAGFFYMHPRNRFWQVLPAGFWRACRNVYGTNSYETQGEPDSFRGAGADGTYFGECPDSAFIRGDYF